MSLIKKKYKYLYKKVCDKNVIEAGFYKMESGNGKSRRKEIIAIKRNFDYCVNKMQEMLESTKPDGVYVENEQISFKPKYKKQTMIKERGKIRELYKPSIIEQWVHSIILVVLEPILEKRFYAHAYGCVKLKKRKFKKQKPKHMKAVEKWVNKGFRYFLKLDIRHCYKNIKIKNVIKHLSEFIVDDYMLNLIKRCFEMYDENGKLVYEMNGLPLGFRLSPWLCNSYLSVIDYMIRIKHGFKMYLRYVDDMIICGNDKRKLHALLKLIKMELGKIRLRLKNNWQLCKFDYIKKNGKRIGRPVDIMGFKYYRDRTILRKHIIYRMERIANKIAKSNHVYHKHAISICSSMGYILHTDCYRWYVEKIKPNVEIRKMKKITSKYAKKIKGERKNDRMEERDMRFRKTKRTVSCFE